MWSRHSGANIARAETIHIHAVPRPPHGQHPGELNNTSFGSRIGQPRVDNQARDRGRIHNFSAAVGDHIAAGGLATQKHTGQVNIEFLLPIGLAEVFRLPKFEDTGIIKGKVQSAQLFRGGLEQLFDLVFLRHVYSQGTRLSTLGADLFATFRAAS